MISTILATLFLAVAASASPAPSPTPTASYGCYEPRIAYGSPSLASVSFHSPCPTPCNYNNYPYNNGYRTSECLSVDYPCNSDCCNSYPRPTVIASYSAVPCLSDCGYNCGNGCGYPSNYPYNNGYNNGYPCGYNGYNCGDCYNGNCGKYYIPPVTFTTKTIATKTDLITRETRVPVPVPEYVRVPEYVPVKEYVPEYIPEYVPVHDDCYGCNDYHHSRVNDFPYSA